MVLKRIIKENAAEEARGGEKAAGTTITTAGTTT